VETESEGRSPTHPGGSPAEESEGDCARESDGEEELQTQKKGNITIRRSVPPEEEVPVVDLDSSGSQELLSSYSSQTEEKQKLVSVNVNSDPDLENDSRGAEKGMEIVSAVDSRVSKQKSNQKALTKAET